MKKHCEVEHFDILKCMLMKFYNNILLKQMFLQNKVQKVITLGSIFAIFSSTITYSKLN
jgi:hypothetical protein